MSGDDQLTLGLHHLVGAQPSHEPKCDQKHGK
jgi:hypothetical protein